MFKVTTITNQTQRIFVLEGSLVDPWLSSLKEKWDEERRAQEGAMFVIDLTKVTIVSQHGENILLQLFTDGARLAGNSPLARMVIHQVEQRRRLQREERKGKADRRASLTVGIVMLLVLAGRLSSASTWGPLQSDSRSLRGSDRPYPPLSASHDYQYSPLSFVPSTVSTLVSSVPPCRL